MSDRLDWEKAARRELPRDRASSAELADMNRESRALQREAAERQEEAERREQAEAKRLRRDRPPVSRVTCRTCEGRGCSLCGGRGTIPKPRSRHSTGKE